MCLGCRSKQTAHVGLSNNQPGILPCHAMPGKVAKGPICKHVTRPAFVRSCIIVVIMMRMKCEEESYLDVRPAGIGKGDVSELNMGAFRAPSGLGLPRWDHLGWPI